MRRFLPKRYLTTRANPIKVRDNYSLGNEAKITIIEVDQKALVLDVTEEILPYCIKWLTKQNRMIKLSQYLCHLLLVS
ncbi:MAG TPA: flagellar biosynthetic protein FliO [Arsenophonus sp.]